MMGVVWGWGNDDVGMVSVDQSGDLVVEQKLHTDEVVGGRYPRWRVQHDQVKPQPAARLLKFSETTLVLARTTE